MFESMSHTSLIAAFLAGLLSFVSPCVLPLVPSYVMYITGLSLDQLTDAGERRRMRKTIVLNALFFIVGFSGVFIAFGASASLIGQGLANHQALIRRIGGAVIILFGLHLTGLLKLEFLMTERRVHLRRRSIGYLGSLAVGATFAAGWTPCVGPVLGTMLLYASSQDRLTDGVALLSFYSFGLGLPLFMTAVGLDRFLACVKHVRAYFRMVSLGSGAVLIWFGIMIYSDRLADLTSFFERYGIGWYWGIDGE